MRKKLEFRIWTLFEVLGFDLENDNDACELIDACIDQIIDDLKPIK